MKFLVDQSIPKATTSCSTRCLLASSPHDARLPQPRRRVEGRGLPDRLAAAGASGQSPTGCETREYLAGFNLIEAADMDEALRVAQSFPWSRTGCIEVRPICDMGAVRQRVGG